MLVTYAFMLYVHFKDLMQPSLKCREKKNINTRKMIHKDFIVSLILTTFKNDSGNELASFQNTGPNYIIIIILTGYQIAYHPNCLSS